MKLSLSQLQIKDGDLLVIRDNEHHDEAQMVAVMRNLKDELRKLGKNVVVLWMPDEVALEVLDTDNKKRVLRLFGCNCEVSA